MTMISKVNKNYLCNTVSTVKPHTGKNTMIQKWHFLICNSNEWSKLSIHAVRKHWSTVCDESEKEKMYEK